MCSYGVSYYFNYKVNLKSRKNHGQAIDRVFFKVLFEEYIFMYSVGKWWAPIFSLPKIGLCKPMYKKFAQMRSDTVAVYTFS